MAKKNSNQTIIKTIGDDGNALIKDCPVLIPKENIDMFMEISRVADENAKRWEDYPNSYKKKVVEQFAKAANSLNENFDFNSVNNDNTLDKEASALTSKAIKEYNYKYNFEYTTPEGVNNILDKKYSIYNTQTGFSLINDGLKGVYLHAINPSPNGILLMMTKNEMYPFSLKSFLKKLQYSNNFINMDKVDPKYINYCRDFVIKNISTLTKYYTDEQIYVSELYMSKDEGIIIFNIANYRWFILITNCVNYHNPQY